MLAVNSSQYSMRSCSSVAGKFPGNWRISGRSWIELRLADVVRLLVLALLDVDALGRTFLLADLAGDAAHALHRVVSIKNEKWKLARGLG